MYWNDGTIYKGFWTEGVQNGIGLMIFKDGTRWAGFFNQNIFVAPLQTFKEFEEFSKNKKKN